MRGGLARARPAADSYPGMGSASGTEPAPRVLVLMPEHWPRALLRAVLREAGYDAVGARDLVEALAHPAAAPDRGPVRLIIVDQRLLQGRDDILLARLLARHGDPATLLLAPGVRAPIEGPWRRVVQRPASIEDILETARAILPLPPEARRSLE